MTNEESLTLSGKIPNKLYLVKTLKQVQGDGELQKLAPMTNSKAKRDSSTYLILNIEPEIQKSCLLLLVSCFFLVPTARS